MEQRTELRKPGNSAQSGGWSGLCTWLSLAFLCMLLSGIASATSRIGPAIYHVRLACTVTGVPASLGITERRLCEEARAAIQELADGDIDANVATAEGWKKFATPNKQVVLQECLEREQGAGACTGYYLLYQGQQVPIIEVDKDAIDKNDPEGVTVIVTLARSTAADSIAVTSDIIEPPFITTPKMQMKLPTIKLEPGPAASSLHAAVKFALAAYFVPDTLDRIMGNVVARRKQ